MALTKFQRDIVDRLPALRADLTNTQHPRDAKLAWVGSERDHQNCVVIVRYKVTSFDGQVFEGTWDECLEMREVFRVFAGLCPVTGRHQDQKKG